MRPRRTGQPDRHRQWACPCGAKRGMKVVRTEHDEDGLPIRLRVCGNCGETLATEERPIPLVSFYPRAQSHDERTRQAEKRKPRTCRLCGRRYTYGAYSTHVRTDGHKAALKHEWSDASRARGRARARRSREAAWWAA